MADAILLPYIMKFNSDEPYAKAKYDAFAASIGRRDLIQVVKELNHILGIPGTLKEVLPDEEAFLAKVDEMAVVSKADGCTKTNPIIPSVEQFRALILQAYYGE